MDIRRSTTILVLGLVLTGCGSAASVPPTASIAPSPAPTAAAVESGSPAESSSPVAAPTASPAADPTPAPSVAAVPAKPTGVTFDRADSQTIEAEGGDTTMTVTWSGPRTEGVEIRVYGITECLSGKTASGDLKDGPCLVEHAALPASSMKLIAKAPSTDGTLSWTWPQWENIGSSLMMGPDGTAYESVVVGAYNEAGNSVFTIAATSEWCGDCTY